LELKERQAAVAARIEHHQQGNDGFRTTLETLISVASRLRTLRAFESGSKTPNDRFGVFEPQVEGQKARVLNAIALRPYGQSAFL